MNKEDCKEKVEEMCDNIKKALVEEAMRLYSCGGVDTSEYDNDYCLPRILIAASKKTVLNGFGPHYPTYKKEVENLEKF